ncbi:restriction endonuclease subunit S [Moraxella canis]|uniref:Restriction endonuclease subunit S n=1 Tax=Moraxella canis TaxID=90239 RepID=A0ABZ0WW27_9GAMM|nr:restriction endonuclease subunit S [Moraxella canis]WQE03463.1 restriction endonuclease subunit S [Moraxella canis]
MKTNILTMIERAEVVWKPLGGIAILQRGRVISKTYLEENKGIYPVYSSQTQNNGEIGRINTFDFDGEFLNWTTDGANAGTIFYRNGKFSITNVSGLIKIKSNSIIIYKFLYYWLVIEAKKYVYSGMGNPKLMSHQIEKIQIPIPPLELQKEIVKRLDILTELEATLEAELTLRKKQYHYYRDFLLSENELAKVGFEWKTLGEIVNLKRGKRLVRSELEETGEYAVYQNSLQPLGYYHQANCPSNSTFIITAGAAGEIGYSYTDFWAADDCYYLQCPKDKLNDRFVYHALMNQKQKIVGQVRKASVPRLGRNSIENIKIPIPPLDTQAKIVAILDKFDHLTSSITDGLPKEIELRRKQYEYYRELLLGFGM